MIDVSTLSGIDLDYWVARCEGRTFEDDPAQQDFGLYTEFWYGQSGEMGGTMPFEGGYSTDWALGGPIIERERIAVINDEDEDAGNWFATSRFQNHWASGTTPLEAAMRCYVASKLGAS